MTRLLTLVTVIFAIISLASAQIVDTLNTPLGPVTQGAKVPVSWTLVNGVDATGKTGELTAQDSTSKNTITIDSAVQLAPKSYTWNVQVPPGTYTLGLNDGSGIKQSGEVVVKAPAGGSPSGGASGAAPGASGSGAPASSPSASPSGTTPGTPATTSSSGTGGGSSGTGSGSSGTGGSGSGGSGGSGGTVSGDAPTDTSSQPSTLSSPKSNSASLIFSGYEVVFSLLVVAIAMVQF